MAIYNFTKNYLKGISVLLESLILMSSMTSANAHDDWKVKLSKCSYEWVPTYDPNGTNEAIITAYTTYPDIYGKFTFKLNGKAYSSSSTATVSNEKGVRCNWDDPNNPQGTKLDLYFPPQSGFTISADGQTATGINTSTAASVRVRSLDDGSYGSISATATVNGVTRNATVVGGTLTYVTIPQDDAPRDQIADNWCDEVPGATAIQDEEFVPNGDGKKGDGFSRYDEYRGFSISGVYESLDPSVKDLFILPDITSLGSAGIAQYGMGDAVNLPVITHMLGDDERSKGDTLSEYNYVNFNSQHHKQKCLQLADGHYSWTQGQGYRYGYTQTIWTPNDPLMGDPTKPYVPNNITIIMIFPESIRATSPYSASRTLVENVDNEAMSWAIGHEIGHGVNIKGVDYNITPTKASIMVHNYLQSYFSPDYQSVRNRWFNIFHTYDVQDNDQIRLLP